MNLDELEIGVEVVDVEEQRRAEWMAKRAGNITCSRFGDLIGSGKPKDALFTQTGYRYLRQLVAERLGSWCSTSATSMQWGTDHEIEAKCEYENQFRLQVESGQYVYHEYSKDVGGTPDGLVGLDGCIEIKCPYDPSVHVNTLLTKEVPEEYIWQVHGHLLVTGRKWCDFVSFDPRIPEEDRRRLVRIRVERNLPALEVLEARLKLAVKEIERMMDLIK